MPWICAGRAYVPNHVSQMTLNPECTTMARPTYLLESTACESQESFKSEVRGRVDTRPHKNKAAVYLMLVASKLSTPVVTYVVY